MLTQLPIIHLLPLLISLDLTTAATAPVSDSDRILAQRAKWGPSSATGKKHRPS